MDSLKCNQIKTFPLISVIVPVFNSEKFLKRCIDSIIYQSFTDIEVILVDDGSTDGSGNMCDEYASLDSRVKVFHKKNGGVSSARNLGIENSTGDYIVFVDSDDWVDTIFLERLYSLVVDKCDIIISEFVFEYGNYRSFSNNSTIYNGKIEYLRYQIIKGFTLVGNIMFCRDFVTKEGLRFENVKYSEDFIFFVKSVCFATNIGYINEALYHYDRTNELSVLHNYPSDMYKDLMYCDTLVIEILKSCGLFNELKREMYWRVLRNKADLVLSRDKHFDFKYIIPESHNYILSCPVINLKMKAMMWLLCHNYDFIVRIFIRVRNLLER